ncbi:MAG: four helix bundle protein [Gemmatimonadaceae bacterium]|nr:four helix bundle protein [Gemmatimonadaceae bacterium]
MGGIDVVELTGLGELPCVRDFRGLDVWRKAHALMLNVRRVTRDFHRARSGPLQSQITRSSEAIPNNIVEGCFAATQKEFARYLDISIKSSGETEYQLQQARDRGLLGMRDWRSMFAQTVEVRKMLIGLRKKILRDLSDDQPE